jgi:hypothetical protein
MLRWLRLRASIYRLQAKQSGCRYWKFTSASTNGVHPLSRKVRKRRLREAWRDGRLPLIASEEQDYRRLSPLKPLIWNGRPSPDDHDIEVVAGVIFVVPRRKLGPREAYLPEPPISSTDLPTVIKGPVRGECLADPSDPKEPEVFKDQPIPTNISLADIEFKWIVGAADWHDEATGAITLFHGIKAKRADVEQIWPPIVALSTARWAKDEVDRMKDAGEIQPGIKCAALARIIKPRLDAAAKAGLVEHPMKQKPLEQALSRHWGLWPVTE